MLKKSDQAIVDKFLPRLLVLTNELTFYHYLSY